jgi:hypothetical protein
MHPWLQYSETSLQKLLKLQFPRAVLYFVINIGKKAQQESLSQGIHRVAPNVAPVDTPVCDQEGQSP